MAAAFSGVMPGRCVRRTSSVKTSTARLLATFPDFAPPMPSQTIMSTRSRPNGTIA